MCKFFSGVYDRTRDMLFTGPTDSHSKICELHGIRETSSLAERNIVKLEYVPRGAYSNLDGYDLRVDEERTPDWWTDELAERVTLRMHRRLLAERVLVDGQTYNITGGLYLVFSGAPVITQHGGEILTYGPSAPVITQHGGGIRTSDSSTPAITQFGGDILTYSSSAPVITQHGGRIWTHGSGVPTITQFGGDIRTHDFSMPVITQFGGDTRTRDSSVPAIEQFGGKLYTSDFSLPAIVRSGGTLVDMRIRGRSKSDSIL